MALWSDAELAFIFGLLGNVVSFLVFLAPVPTFHKICKRKSSEGFQSIPYAVALFSASLLLYYAYLKKNASMIISINGIGCIIEVTYLFIYLLHASKTSRIFTMKFILVLNVGALGLVILCSFVIVKGQNRVTLVGWICAIVNLAVFAAPLSIMRQVIKTKSVEFMPFTLSLFLTLCAIMWFFYGFFIHDFFIAVPNVLGFILGITQMGLYLIYKNSTDNEMNFKLDKTFDMDIKIEGRKEAHKDVEMNLTLSKTIDNITNKSEDKLSQPNSTKQGKNNGHMINVKIEE